MTTIVTRELIDRFFNEPDIKYELTNLGFGTGIGTMTANCLQ